MGVWQGGLRGAAKDEASATAVAGTFREPENGSGEVMGSKEGLASKVEASGVVGIETEAAPTGMAGL